MVGGHSRGGDDRKRARECENDVPMGVTGDVHFLWLFVTWEEFLK